jgi:hypothetical protein
MKAVLKIAILLVLAIYLGDYVSAKYQIPSGRQTLDTVEIQRDFALMQKDRKFEYLNSTVVEEECVLSLFPHFSDPPCWYLRRHTQQHVVMDPATSGPLFDH